MFTGAKQEKEILFSLGEASATNQKQAQPGREDLKNEESGGWGQNGGGWRQNDWPLTWILSQGHQDWRRLEKLAHLQTEYEL
ncbi:unnamed protein product [Caenorhabditis nigoni]